MNLEIERRFLINESNFTLPKIRKSIKQGYLFSDSNQALRVRMFKQKYFLTYNIKNQLSIGMNLNTLYHKKMERNYFHYLITLLLQKKDTIER